MARYVWNLSYLAISIIPTVGAARIKPTVSLNCKTKFQPVEATDKKNKLVYHNHQAQHFHVHRRSHISSTTEKKTNCGMVVTTLG